MVEKYSLIITPKAYKDLEDIFDYTCEHWSYQQAIKYASLLDSCFEDLALNLIVGREYPYSNKKYLYIKSGKHLIFYRYTENECIVVRILHEKIDLDNYL